MKINKLKQSFMPLPPCFTGEPAKCGFWRMEAFHRIWEKIEESIKVAFTAQNTNSFKEILKFIRDMLFSDAQLELYLSTKANHSTAHTSVSKQLHAALVYLRNVDSSDHSSTFADLKHYLQTNNCHVTNLRPHHFSSKLGTGGPLHNIITQMVKINPDTANMDIIVSWHRTAENMKLPIVIIVEDAEQCNPTVLADFLVILSEWRMELPIVLVLGIATSVDALTRLLPASTTRHLQVHSFALPSSQDYLESIIESVIATPSIPFGIGCDVLRFLLTHYRTYDSTVTSFVRALKMACMEHFFSQPLSFVCLKLLESNDQVQLDEFCISLPQALLQYCSSLPSVESEHEEGHQIGKRMSSALATIKEQKAKWSVAVKCVLASCKVFGLDSVGAFLEMSEKSMPIGVFTNVDGPVSNVISNTVKRLRDLSEQNISRLLNTWAELAGQSGDLMLKNEIQSVIQKESLMSVVHEGIDSQEVSNEASTSNGVGASDMLLGSSGVGGRLEHSQTNRDLAIPKKSPLKVLGKIAANILERLLRQHVVHLESLSFQEIVCFNNVSAIKQSLVGETRRSIQDNVQYAHATLLCGCCKSKGDTPLGSMNDSSILFCLAKNSGGDVNLFDLYKDFENVLSNDRCTRSSNRPKKKQKQAAAEDTNKALCQARFCKAMSELQLVGLFRMPAKKRIDCVQVAI